MKSKISIGSKNSPKIFDEHISFANFATFKRCRILADGWAVRFVLANGSRYDVPLSYLLTLFSHPHYVSVDGELLEWKEQELLSDIGDEAISIVKCRRVLLKTAVNIYLNNNAVYTLPWDTLLMACEPLYEHFGGLTDASKKIVDEWHEKLRENDPETKLYSRRLRLCKPQRRILLKRGLSTRQKIGS